jgi:hypothetical protein
MKKLMKCGMDGGGLREATMLWGWLGDDERRRMQ